MKLYTEEQVKQMLEVCRDSDLYEHILTFEDILKTETPIELPSDEEIDRESEVLYPINKGGSMWMPSRYDIDKKNRQEGFLDGAKWMRDKIQGGNNEQQ
jgi:hypothetical protein